ncbi:hypothetical protein [Pseudoalteromonas ardens]|uniref:ASP external chaperone domain-containing protein n=1 Tax=Pseudoalteromonas rubra TaxID=43658 RepID=A0A0L0EVJ7_9GAMM|nr:hypothetical protein [Pseudoalteromonas sp. R96]KNC68434.1 hypothetical protein AC626_04795 [Pseudoalteromonas rubra]MDK1312071.1 hypothetical protein [Pseudoalteromonas sp. R96]
MKKHLITTALLACGISTASASSNEVYEAQPLSTTLSHSVTLNGKSYLSASERLLTGVAITDAKTGTTYILTGEVVAELEPLINAQEFAAAHNLELVYVRANRAIFAAQPGTELNAFKAHIEGLAGVTSTQFGIDIEGLESE